MPPRVLCHLARRRSLMGEHTHTTLQERGKNSPPMCWNAKRQNHRAYYYLATTWYWADTCLALMRCTPAAHTHRQSHRTHHITHRMLQCRSLPVLVLLVVVMCSAAAPIMGQAHAQRQADRPVLASVGLENKSAGIRLQAQDHGDHRQPEALADGTTSRVERASALVGGPAPSTPTHMRSFAGAVSAKDTIPRVLESMSEVMPTETSLMPTTAPSGSPSLVPTR
jgi:hypothetical protein